MLPNRMPVSARLGLLVVVLVATVGVVTAQVKSPPRSHFVLSSPDARLAIRVPEEYTANVFRMHGRKYISRIAVERRAGRNQEFRNNVVRSGRT
jgi:hypothetical protein